MIWLLVGYMVLFIHRPFEIWPVLATVRLERVYMLFILGVVLLSGRAKLQSHPVNRAIGFFVASVLICWFLSPWFSTVESQKVVVDWLKIIVFYLLAVALVRNREELQILTVGLLIATGLYVTHSVVEYHLGRHQFSMGVRRLLGINDTLRHPNSFASVALITMPFAFFVFRQHASRWMRRASLAYVVVATYGVILTSSRMGIVGLICLVVMLMAKSRQRFKLATLAMTIAIVGWTLLPENKQNRILSIYSSEYGPQNANESADSRIESFWIGLDLFREYPLTGVGPGAWQAASGSEIVSHNLYGQVIGETGLLGSAAFLLLNIVCLRQASLLRKESAHSFLPDEASEYYADFGLMLLRAFTLMLLFGLAGGTLFRHFWIWNSALLMMATTTHYDEELAASMVHEEGGTADFLKEDAHSIEPMEAGILP